MGILLVSMEYSYGDRSRERSYEYFNFYKTLIAMGHDVELYDYMDASNGINSHEISERLVERVVTEKPKLVIFSLYTDQIEAWAVERIRAYATTFCFFHDDTWRVEFSQFWAGKFDYFSSPDLYASYKYSKVGINNCLYFPFGCNEEIFRKQDCEKAYDVSFVGAWHPYREWIINKLVKRGFSVHVFGHGWGEGEVSQDEMVRIFNKSKINLNLSNSASWDARYLFSSYSAFKNRIRSKKNIEQMKARFFEVCGCGSFQLSYFVEGLSACYKIDEELAVYANSDDLYEKVSFYLEFEDIREKIASNGYQRTIRDHTFKNRFNNILNSVGFEA
ncbi:CgeB family protein [Neptuniibacter pectenicola]|jgi:spore maturation protein CgeB|uniref:CgeB family protein n=1 Tax=Neptuniibacter pectenicola TaxID=1806669 RepID=UPI0030EE1CD3